MPCSFFDAEMLKNKVPEKSKTGGSGSELPAFEKSVHLKGLEPSRRETPDPKSGASTNSATGAFEFGVANLQSLLQTAKRVAVYLASNIFMAASIIVSTPR